MAASAFIVKLPLTSGGRTLPQGADACVVWAADAAEAKMIASKKFSGDSGWSDADAVAVVATDFNGYTLRCKVYDTTPPIDISVVGDATNNTIDELAALAVTALNATQIDNAAYNSTTQVLTVAAIGDNIGNKKLLVELYAPGCVEPATGLVGTIVDQGIAGAVLTAVLPADAITPPVIAGMFKQV